MKIVGVSKSGHMKDHFDETYTIEEIDKVIGEANIIVNFYLKRMKQYTCFRNTILNK